MRTPAEDPGPLDETDAEERAFQEATMRRLTEKAEEERGTQDR
jgi:hypothetical protein